MKKTARNSATKLSAQLSKPDVTTLDDQALVAALLDRGNVPRSDRAWRELMRRYESTINKRLRRIIGNCSRVFRASDTFDEIKAEVFMSLMAKDMDRLRRFNAERGSLGGWLAMIAHQTAITYLTNVVRGPMPFALEAVDENCDAGYGEEDKDDRGDGQIGARWIALSPF